MSHATGLNLDAAKMERRRRRAQTKKDVQVFVKIFLLSHENCVSTFEI